MRLYILAYVKWATWGASKILEVMPPSMVLVGYQEVCSSYKNTIPAQSFFEDL